MKKLLLLPLAFLGALLTGCIKNDIPYPRIQPNFLTFAVNGEASPSVIDSINRTVSVTLSEEVDIRAVTVSSYTVTPDAAVEPGILDRPMNLTSPVDVTLSIYQDYIWTIQANQTITRSFSVVGQIGQSEIDVPARRVIVTVPETIDLKKIQILEAKLGPTGSAMNPEIVGETIDLSNPFSVTVTVYGQPEEWKIYAMLTKSTVTTERADAWTRVAWVYAQAEEGKKNGIQYRRTDSPEWITVPDSWITVNGGSFHARIINLQPETEYATRAFSGEEFGAELTFTTGAEVQVPNSDFEYWWLNGKVWNPWQEGGVQYWDTGNKGATTLGPSNTTPTDDTPTGEGRAARLETKFVGIGTLGKLAAGNIFVGYYVRTDGTNGILSFGREFTQRPTRLKGYLKYNCADISHSSAGYEDLKGRPDTCIVWSALIDSDEPFEIRTNPKDRHLFDPAGPEVVAYGNIQYGRSVDEYIPFEFEFQYTATNRIPNYILIVASASKYGDYFTGGNGSVLYVDDLELLYDY